MNLTVSLLWVAQLSQNNAEDVVQLTGFVNHACHFFECIYDPYFMWRKQLTGYVHSAQASAPCSGGLWRNGTIESLGKTEDNLSKFDKSTAVLNPESTW